MILWMSLRVGIVPCVSKFDTLGLFLSLLKTWGSDTFVKPGHYKPGHYYCCLNATHMHAHSPTHAHWHIKRPRKVTYSSKQTL